MRDLFLNQKNQKKIKLTKKLQQTQLGQRLSKPKLIIPKEYQFSTIKISGTIRLNPSPSLPVVPHSHLLLSSSKFLLKHFACSCNSSMLNQNIAVNPKGISFT